MASTFVVIAVILSFERLKANAAALLLGIITFSVLSAEISLSLYLTLVRPLGASGPTLIYTLVGLIPLGLGLTMFTIASIVNQ
jgi:hypothetical protein